jgi:hypothetical protein
MLPGIGPVHRQFHSVGNNIFELLGLMKSKNRLLEELYISRKT